MLVHIRFCRALGVHIAVAVMLLSSGFGFAQALRVATDVPVQLDPAFASSDSEIAVLNAIYDYLVDINADNNITPRLATSWEVSEDGLTYTFTLAEGVTFHDGDSLSAEDVVWTYNRLRDPELELPTTDLYANIADITAVADNQVQFTLSETNPFFLYDLSDNHAFILEEGTEDPASELNGTGPFVVTDFLVASLGFLGVGVQPPRPDWGLMVSEARNYAALTPWALYFPALAISLLVIGMNLMADGLKRVLQGAE